MKKRAVLLTGRPGCGKTTLIQRVVARLSGPVGGFYTREIRSGGARLGFEIATLDGRRAVLARTDLHSSQRVGRYGVSLKGLETLAVDAIRQAVAQGGVVVIDEIGPMEMLSAGFRQAVLQALDSPAQVLGTIVGRSTPFSDWIKARPDVTVLEVTVGNRDQMLEKILNLIEPDL